MRRAILILAAAGFTLFAGNVTCPVDPGSVCWGNGKVSTAGAHGYSCSCGHEVWAK